MKIDYPSLYFIEVTIQSLTRYYQCTWQYIRFCERYNNDWSANERGKSGREREMQMGRQPLFRRGPQ